MSSAAVVSKLAGNAFVIRNGQETRLRVGEEIQVTDTIRTEADSKVELIFRDGSEVDLGPLTRAAVSDFVFEEAGQDPAFGLHVLEGLARTATGKVVEQNPEGFSLTTPLGSAGIRGTVIWADVSEKQVVFTVTELGVGHTVIITTSDGRSVILHLPETGVIIQENDITPLQIFDVESGRLEEYLRSVFEEDLYSDASDGFYVLADAAFLAQLGVIEQGPLFLPFAGIDALISALQNSGIDTGGLGNALPGLGNTDLGNWGGGQTPGGPSIPAGAVAWPSATLNGTNGANTLLGNPNQHHTISGGPGNDLIVTYNGNDVIQGGYGSRDAIIKLGDVSDTLAVQPGDNTRTEIYGDASGTLNLVNTDSNDIIIVRGAGPDDASTSPWEVTDSVRYGAVTMSGGVISGDGDVLTNSNTRGFPGVGNIGTAGEGGVLDPALTPEFTLTDGDYIALYGFMTGGVIYGDGRIISGGEFGHDEIYIMRGLDPDKLAQGVEEMIGGDMSGGIIYGDAEEVGPSSGLGDDTIYIAGNMSGGAIYGDAAKGEGNGVRSGNDEITIKGVMSDGAIYGDVANFGGGTIAYGNDTIDVEGKLSGGIIVGDAEVLNDSAWFGSGYNASDQIVIGGEYSETPGPIMDGGIIYGDAVNINMGAGTSIQGDGVLPNVEVLFYDIIILRNDMTGSTIYGDAETANFNGVAVITNSFNDYIDVQGSVSGSLIYGDAKTLNIGIQRDGDTGVKHDYNQNIFSDIIKIGGDVSNSTIYGDAESLSFSMAAGSAGYAKSDLGTSMNDAILVQGNLVNATIYGDAKTISSVTFNNIGATTDFKSAFVDTIVVEGSVNAGSLIYGDSANWSSISNSISTRPADPVEPGDPEPPKPPTNLDQLGGDTIWVGALNGGSIYTGFGKDTLHVDNFSSGKVDGGSGELNMSIANLNGSGGNIYAASGGFTLALAKKTLDKTNQDAPTIKDNVAQTGTIGNGAVLNLHFGDGNDKLDISGATMNGGSATINIYNYQASGTDSIVAGGWTAGTSSATMLQYTSGGGTLTINLHDGPMII